MAKMTPETLRRLLDDGIQQSTLWASETVRDDQLRNLQYFLGYPMGNEIEGRSQIISWDVFEIVESAMPGFMEPFFSGDNIGEFTPRTQDDEAFSDQATDYINYLVKDENPGFLIFNTWIKDALISKIGVVRAEWVKVEPKRFELEGISTEQLVQITQDPRVEVLEHSAELDPNVPPEAVQQALMQGMPPPALHDITYTQAQDGRLKIENVRPENFIFTRGAARVDKCRVVGEIVTYTRSDLAEMGFKEAMTVDSFDLTAAPSDDMTTEQVRTGTQIIIEADSADKTLEEVKLFRGFIRADYDGDGIAEWRQILAGCGEDGILENEEAEGPDYCVITPIPIPHRIIGMAYADPAREIQNLKTALTRQYLDGLYAAAYPKTYVNMDAKVNLSDLISTKIGGVVRGNGPALNAVQPLVTTVVSKDALEGLQMADGMRETRLGIPKINPGLEADALHKTATGVRSVNALVDKRQKMTLRVLAETGIKDLFKLALRLTCKHQDQPRTVRLRNEWVPFNPREWSPDMDCITDVGIGTGDKTETVMMLQQYAQYMQWAQANGVVTPQNVFEFGVMLAKNAKLKGAETKLLTDPKTQPPAQPQPPIELIKIQAQQQADAQKLQADGQIAQLKMQQDAQLEQVRAQAQREIDINRQQAEAEQHAMKMQQEAQLAQLRMQMEDAQHQRKMDYDRWKAELDAATKIEVANISSKAKVDNAATAAATNEIAQEVQQ